MDTTTPAPTDTRRRATLWFWSLVVIGIALVGALSRELVAPPSPRTGAAVALTGLLAVLVVVQAARLMLGLLGTRRR